MNAARRRCLVVTLVGLWLAGCSHDVGVVDLPAEDPDVEHSVFVDAGLETAVRVALARQTGTLPAEELAGIPTVCGSLREALECLAADHDFLLQGDVFTKDMLDAFIALKEDEVQRLNVTVHPVEFDMYYSC